MSKWSYAMIFLFTLIVSDLRFYKILELNLAPQYKVILKMLSQL